jgi:hypothetical protein
VEAWWQVAPRLALGALTGLRSPPPPYERRLDVIAGIGVVVALTPRLDLKSMLFTPRLQTAWTLGDDTRTNAFSSAPPNQFGVALAIALEGRLE